ncbi:flavin-containing monooxygenase [Microlunatus sp. GCM10028923]|uniref:flavin-containing monooxygenase n=1 Tax=Microlunatus sp. GCM10028923 TaxID=3273400 RepID=UPI00360CC35E
MTRRIMIIGGGQSGLAAARTARDAGWDPVVLEAGTRPVGSWPDYYDSLTLFSPAAYSGFPGYNFPGHPDRYPARDEVAAFLNGYAAWLGVDIQTETRVIDVSPTGPGFAVHTDDGRVLSGDAVVAASGSFGHPVRPRFPGRDKFTGEVLTVAEYRSPERFADQRVVVVGAGNSAIQVGYELAGVARVSLAVRSPVQLVPQVRAGRDMHYWFKTLRLDLLPPAALARLFKGTLVFDTGTYRAALDSGRFDQRPVFTEFTETGVRWADGTTEPVDTVIFATGYRPSLPYLAELGALDPTGLPLHRRGLSLTHPRLAYLGLEFQRSFSSNTLRGVHRDAGYVINVLSSRVATTALTDTTRK